MDTLRRIAHSVNRGITRGAQRCSAMKADAQETVRRGRGGDILYLDPPYAGTLAYEEKYRILDELLGESHEANDFSTKNGLAELIQLLSLCGEYPLWVISYGNAVAGVDEVREAVGQFRPVRAMEIAYQHLGSVASQEKKAKNRELLLLAGEGVC